MNYELSIKHKKINFSKRAGFTLIEMLVALAIFAIVVAGAAVIFVNAVKGQRKISALQAVEENARFALEMMVKEIRMSVINSSAGALSDLDITAHKANEDGSSLDVPVVYKLQNGQILRNGEGVSSGQMKVSQLKFYVNKDVQPLVTIVMTVENKAQKSEQQAKINLETTVSLRSY